jgi:cytochrome o ubiquinol oxidase subunit 1
MLGKLTWDAIPFNEPIALVTSIVVILGALAILAIVTVMGWWPYLWKEWLTSVDHKRIGVMYVFLALVMLLRGFADGIMMRSQQAIAVGGAEGYLDPGHYNQIFSAHGTIMIFFVAMPFVVGLMNFAVPLQLGVRDVAFPVLNSVSFWLTASGALLVNLSLFIGNFARTGWMGYPPLSELAFSPDVGVDYYLWSLQISGVGTLLAGINMVTTILKVRAPGMLYFRMPVFCWTALASNMLIIAAFPILTATFAMLLLDRHLGMHFFTNEAGGNQMMYVNLFWAWGHPEVYILILPAFGVFSEVFATFSGKALFGYRSMVLATLAICVVSFMVWLHHFFTMGAGANVNAFFGLMSMVIAVPTGVKVFNWLFTMFHGRLVFTTPVLFSIGFVVTFVIGGMTGVLLAIPPVDFILHNSVFLIAHFHNVIIGGVLFGAIAGYNYWFPKAFGFTLDERFGKASFWCWFVGFYLAFMPLYMLGLMGMTRRLQHISDPSWQPLLLVAEAGAVVIFLGILCQIAQLYVSIRTRASRRDLTGDPYNARTLEWATASPPPAYNFAIMPEVGEVDWFWEMKKKADLDELPPTYETIEMPRNSPTGFVSAFFAVLTGFALIWHIWWLAILALLGAAVTMMAFGWSENREFEISAAEVARIEQSRHEHRHPRFRFDRGRDRSRRGRSGADADCRRLWVLDLPAQRHHPIFRTVRRLCGAAGQCRRRTDRA